MVDRDTTWTEYIRQNTETFEKIIGHLENTSKNQADLSELLVLHINLYAEGVMWVLTSTVRPLRDKATRALYWFGRRFPEQLLQLTKKSFTINDPYIRERMLAAVYGIAMAMQYDLEDRSFPRKNLACIRAGIVQCTILCRSTIRDNAYLSQRLCSTYHPNCPTSP